MIPQVVANNLLEELGISELPIIPKDLCQRLKIQYYEEPLNNLDGFLIINPKNGHSVISVNTRINDEGRKNFTTAHEIGHFCMDSLDRNDFYCSRDSIESFRKTIQPMELRANEFAAELLMPTSLVKPLIQTRDLGWDQIKSLTTLSQTSLTATAIRFIDLTDEACALIVSEDGKISWFRKSDEFHPFVLMENRLLSQDTIAYEVFRGSEPPDWFENVKADNWISGKGVNPYTEILEWTLPLNSYGLVLTLLFDEEGIVGWDEDDLDEDDEVEWEPPTFHKSKRKK